MRAEQDLRMPYGPGWEDPDWSAHACPPDDSAAPRAPRSTASLPVVRTLGQYMAILHRVAGAARPRATPPAASLGRRPATPSIAGSTGRWVMATGASLVALATLPAARPERFGDDRLDDQAQVAADDTRTPLQRFALRSRQQG